MKYLAIDTSTERASVALANGEQIYYAEQDNAREHAQHLLPIISQLLTDSGLLLHELDGIIVGRGPGSFTGLRIACSVVKGLAYPHSLPVYPVSSLAAIANEFFYSETDLIPDMRVLTMIDARMHEVYWDCYTADGEHLEERVSPASQLSLPFNGPCMIAGVGFEGYLPQLPEVIKKQCIGSRTVYPDARAMIRLVRLEKCLPVSAADVLPVYVRNQVVKGASGG